MLTQRSPDYVQAARAMGCGPARILFRHPRKHARPLGGSSDAGRRCRDPDLCRPQLPWARYRSPTPGMGADGLRGERADRAVVGCGLPGARDLQRRRGLQLSGDGVRRLARLGMGTPVVIPACRPASRGLPARSASPSRLARRLKRSRCAKWYEAMTTTTPGKTAQTLVVQVRCNSGQHQDGSFKPGDRLPTEAQMTIQHGVAARSSARRS
ncbi:hypothetical protein [Bosea thiooxidans]